MEVVAAAEMTWLSPKTVRLGTRHTAAVAAPTRVRQPGIRPIRCHLELRLVKTGVAAVVVVVARMFKPVNPCLVLQEEAELSLFGGLLRI
jgi:hypothetical protein